MRKLVYVLVTATATQFISEPTVAQSSTAACPKTGSYTAPGEPGQSSEFYLKRVRTEFGLSHYKVSQFTNHPKGQIKGPEHRGWATSDGKNLVFHVSAGPTSTMYGRFSVGKGFFGGSCWGLRGPVTIIKGDSELVETRFYTGSKTN